MWDLPGPGIEPVSPALAGGFLTTVPPGKSLELDFYFLYFLSCCQLYHVCHVVSGVGCTFKEVGESKKFNNEASNYQIPRDSHPFVPFSLCHPTTCNPYTNLTKILRVSCETTIWEY